MKAGELYVVATPLGNLQDISERALAVLREVRAVYAEDTRRSRVLLRHFGIEKPLHALHEHNERRIAPKVVARLERGEHLALVSDAGTPLISDPGYLLLQAVRGKGLRVVPIPGPCALVCALSAAGLPSDRFVFEGFLPVKAAARSARLQELADEERTLVFYEAPHRIVGSLRALAAALGERREAAVARELTKRYETIHSGTLGSALGWLGQAPENRKGEFVIVVAGRPRRRGDALSAERERVLRLLLQDLPLKQAVSIAARLTGGARNPLYRRAVALTEEEALSSRDLTP